MRGLHVLIGLGLLGTLASPAAASPQRDYAACVARVQPGAVDRLLEAQSDDSSRRAFRDVAHNEYCYARAYASGTYQLQDDALSVEVMRGLFAEQYLLRNSRTVAALSALPMQSRSYVRPWFAATGRAVAVDEMASCMADTDPAGVMGLLRTVPGSWGEQAWMTSLPASLSRCLAAGVHLDANRTALRAALADALYQRVRAQPATMTSSR